MQTSDKVKHTANIRYVIIKVHDFDLECYDFGTRSK